MKPYIVLGLVAATLAACGSDEPAAVAGDYTIALTNRENGCENPNWTVDDTVAGVVVVITQNGATANADVQPQMLARAALDAVLGNHVFIGSVDGNDLDLLIEGTVSFSRNTCDYTIDAQIDATLEGDVLSGSIYYRAKTDGSVDCGTLTGCASRQELLGNRPPS